jgi:hypothetical protein
MTTCLKYCTPIAAVMFLGAAFWQYALPQRNFFGLLRAPAAMYGVNEGWNVASRQSAAAEDARPAGETVSEAPQRHIAAAFDGAERGG